MSNIEALFKPVTDLIDSESKIDQFYRMQIEASLAGLELNDANRRDLENLALLMQESGKDDDWDLFELQLDNLKKLSNARNVAGSQVSRQSRRGQAEVKKSVNTPSHVPKNSQGASLTYMGGVPGEWWEDIKEGLGVMGAKFMTPDVIAEIEISGNITKEKAMQRNERFQGILENNSELEDLKATDRTFIIEQLTELIDTMASEKGFALSHINGYFNGLAKNIQEKGGKWYVELSKDNGESLLPAFDSKDEALKAIELMKEDAEGSFEKAFDDFGVSTFIELIGGYISIMTVPYDMIIGASKSSLSNAWDALSILPGGEESDIFSASLDAIQGTIWGLTALSIGAAVGTVHSGAIDTIYRRGFKDLISMVNEKKQFENYAARGPGFIAPSIDQPGGKDYFEYMQRQSLMDQLYIEFEANFSPGTNEYDAFKKELASLERYKLNKTPTFYYKAYQLIEFHDKGFIPKSLHKLYSFFIRGGIVWRPDWLWKVQRDDQGKPLRNAKGNKIREMNKVPFAEITRIADDQILYSKIMLALNAKEDSIRNGLNDFYSHVETSGDDISSFKVLTQNADPDTPLYNAIIDEINARDLPEKKKVALLDRFNKLIKSLPQRYRTQELLARELYYLLEKDYIDKGKASKMIADEIDNKLKGQTTLQQVGEKSDHLLRRNNSVSNRLRALGQLIQSGEWLGTEKELKDVIEVIKTTELKIEENLSVRGLADNGNKTQYLDWYNDYQGQIDDASRNRTIQKAEYFEANDARQYKGEAKLVDNYIKYMSASSLEESAQKNFDAMMKQVYDGKLFIQNGTLFREANLIVQGYLPMYLIRDLHANIDAKNIRTPDGQAVYKQISKALDSGLEIYISQNLTQDLGRLATLRDANPFQSVAAPSSTVDFNSFDGLADYDDFDVKRALGVEKNDQIIAKLAHISEYIDILHGQNSVVSTEFEKFISSLKTNAYTLSQAKYIMTQLIGGENFANVDYVTNAGHNSRDTLNSLAETLGREFDNKFLENADLEGKIDFYESHARVAKSQELKNKFIEISRVIQDEINEEENLRMKKIYYERLSRSSPEGSVRTELTSIIQQLDSDIKEEGRRAETDAEKRRETAQQVEQDKNTLQGYVDRLDRAQNIQEIAVIEKQYYDLIGSERGARLNVDELEGSRQEIIERISSMKQRFTTAPADIARSSNDINSRIAELQQLRHQVGTPEGTARLKELGVLPTVVDVSGFEVKKMIEALITELSAEDGIEAGAVKKISMKVFRQKFVEFRDLGDRISLELMMKYEGEELSTKLGELNTLINDANDTSNFQRILGENDNLEVFFRDKFGMEKIRTQSTLKTKLRKAKVNLPDDMPKDFSDIAKRIRDVTDISAMGSIVDALKKVNISR